MSFLAQSRLTYSPLYPEVLRDLRRVCFVPSGKKRPVRDEIIPLFPCTERIEHHVLASRDSVLRPWKVGVLFSGGPASGGHNVLAALFDGLREISSDSTLVGFLGGPSGLVEDSWRVLDKGAIDAVRNQGGFYLLGTGRTKIETEEQKKRALHHSQHLDALVIIGGDDSNTNAAILAEYFLAHGSKTQVIGIPKTIDGDLRSEDLEISFGFDTATRVYAESIGNIALDAKSAQKYTHWIRIMGRSASHIALECAFLSEPNLVCISEEHKSLQELTHEIADLIRERKRANKSYGVFLLPEGLIESIPEMQDLLTALARPPLSPKLQAFWETLPLQIQEQIEQERDPHGNLSVSQIEVEKLLIPLVQNILGKDKCSCVSHFLGYEGRAALPTNFDANYAYTLGRMACVAIQSGLTGVMAAAKGLFGSPSKWSLSMVPIVSLLHLEERKGQKKPVIQKSLVDKKSPFYIEYCRVKGNWRLQDTCRVSGPIQFAGPSEATNCPIGSLLYGQTRR